MSNLPKPTKGSKSFDPTRGMVIVGEPGPEKVEIKPGATLLGFPVVPAKPEDPVIGDGMLHVKVIVHGFDSMTEAMNDLIAAVGGAGQAMGELMGVWEQAKADRAFPWAAGVLIVSLGATLAIILGLFK